MQEEYQESIAQVMVGYAKELVLTERYRLAMRCSDDEEFRKNHQERCFQVTANTDIIRKSVATGSILGSDEHVKH